MSDATYSAARFFTADDPDQSFGTCDMFAEVALGAEPFFFRDALSLRDDYADFYNCEVHVQIVRAATRECLCEEIERQNDHDGPII